MRQKTSPPISTRCARRAASFAAFALLSLPGLALAQNKARPALPTAPAGAAPVDDGQWTMPTKNYAATRYSTLDQINGNTIKNLRVEFPFSTAPTQGEEAAPT